MGVGEDACQTAYENPGVSIGIIGLTRESIKKIYFKDIMDVINRKYSLRMKVNLTELSYTLPNGSVIYFAGADAKEEEMNKFLGQKYKKVYIDESSMYTTINLRQLVYDILEPAVADYRGQIVMIGTPSNYQNSLYFDITRDDGEPAEKGWSVHRWTCFDNPHVREQTLEMLGRMKERNPDIENDPGFQQHWRGKWAIDPSDKIYKYNAKTNSNPLPHAIMRYTFVLGVDIGWEDDTALVVGGWNEYDSQLHFVHAESEKHLKIDEIERRMKRLISQYNISLIVIDSANKNFLEVLADRFQMGFVPAEKQGKKDFIEMMNGDFLARRINVCPIGCAVLIKEWGGLIWDEKKLDKDPKTGRVRGEWKEDRGCANHAADAALYLWRWCYHYSVIPRDKPITIEKEIENALIRQYTEETQDVVFSTSDLFAGF